MEARAIVLIVLSAFFLNHLKSQNNNPTIAVCNGQQYVCATGQYVDLCVNIIVNPAYPFVDEIDYFEIDWGDGTPITTVPGSTNPPSIQHTYDVGDFFGSCQYEEEYIIKLLTFHNGGSPEPANSAFFLYIRNPPQPQFEEFPESVCSGMAFTLASNDCPSEGLNYQFWDIEGGGGGLGDSITHTIDSSGLYLVQHFAGNVCDTVAVSDTLNVIDGAVADMVPDSGIVIDGNGNLNACMEGGEAIIRIDGLISTNETSYQWTVEGPTGGWEWYPDPAAATSGITRIKFTLPGTYTVTLSVNNSCDAVSDASVTIEVIDPPVLSLSPFPDSCTVVDYTPTPFDSNAVYTINGVVHNSFPINLSLSPNPYVVEATLSHLCGNQAVSDEFYLQEAQDVNILAPGNVTVCAGTDFIPLSASLSGTWSGGNGNLIVTATDTFFNPVDTGMYTLVISRGNGVCMRSDTVYIQVEEPYPLELEDPDDACLYVDYTPVPLDPNVQYTIDGILFTTQDFPVTLEAAGSPYTIEASVQNTCGQVSMEVGLTILEPIEVEIMAPFDTVLCSETELIPLIANDTLGTWDGDHIIDTLPQGPMFDPSVPGTYLIVYERGFGLCRGADSIQIQVEPNSSVVAADDLLLCGSLGTYELPASVPAGGTYSGYGLSGNTVDLSQLQPDSAYVYTYTVGSLPAACNSDVLTLTSALPPDGGFLLSADTSCIGETITISPVDSGNVNFSVDWGDGTDAGDSLAHSYTVPGTYQASYEVYTTNPNAGEVLCADSASITIHIIEPIDVVNIGFNTSIDSGCAPLTVDFNNISVAENATYYWDFGNGQTYIGEQPGSITFEQGIEDTTYTVRLRIDNGCDSTEVTRLIKVAPQPHADFGITYLEPCSGEILETSVLSTGNPDQNTYYTSTGLVVPTTPIETEFFTFYTDSIPDTIGIWLVTSNLCGVDTAYREVVVNPADIVALVGIADTTSLCEEEILTLINYSTPGAFIDWQVSDGNTYLGDTIEIKFDDPGDYTVSLVATGCGYDSISFPLTVHPLPTLEVIHDLQRCLTDSINFEVQTSAAGIELMYGDGAESDQKFSVHYYDQPGLYYPSVLATTDKGCQMHWNGSLEIFPLPDAYIEPVDSVCSGAPIEFHGSSTLPNTSCAWNFSDGGIANGCDVTHTFTEAGLFSAILSIYSFEGCRGGDTIPVFVRAQPSADFEYNILEPCTPGIVAFQSDITGATGMSWDLGDGTLTNLANLQHTYPTGGVFPVTLYATNGDICTDTVTKDVAIYQTPTFDFELDPYCTVAEGTDLTVNTELTNYVTVSSDSYSQVGSFHDGIPGNTYDINIASPEGCLADTTIVVLPPNELLLEVVRDSFRIQLGDSVQLQVQVNQTEVDISWSPDMFLDDPTSFSPVSYPLRNINYVVSGINTLGCVKTDTVWISVNINRDSGLFIPNAFTPNSDGINDVFYVRNSINPSIEKLDFFRVFDKYNEKTFDIEEIPDSDIPKPENPVWGWDGTFRGQKAEAGSYRYTIGIRYVDGKTRVYTGTVQLIR